MLDSAELLPLFLLINTVGLIYISTSYSIFHKFVVQYSYPLVLTDVPLELEAVGGGQAPEVAHVVQEQVIKSPFKLYMIKDR